MVTGTKLTDFRGTEYGVGSTVVYPNSSGRAVQSVEGVVTDIWTVYRHPDTFDWTRLREGEAVPREWRWVWTDGQRERVEQDTPVDNHLRVTIQPTGRESRNFYRSDGRYVKGPDGKHEWVKTGLRAVTILNIQNIVAF